MPKWLKILLWIVGGLMALLIALLLSLNTIVRNTLIEKVDNAIANADSIYISYESIDLDVFTGEIRIKGVAFQTDKLQTDSLRAYSRMEIKDVWLTGVDYKSLFVDKEIDLKELIIDGVTYRGILDTKVQEANDAADAISEEERAQFESLLREAQKYLHRVTLEKLTVKNVSADMRALETGLHLRVSNLNTELYELGYSLRDSIPFYLNDSVYHLDLNDFCMTLPDSLMNLRFSKLYTVQSSRSLVVTDIHYAMDTVPRNDRNYHEVSIDTVRLDSIVVPDMRDERSLSFRDLRIINVSYYGCIDDTQKKKDKKPEVDITKFNVKTAEAKFLAQMQVQEREMLNDQQRRMLELVQKWLDKVNLGCVSLENARMHIASYKTNLDITSENINVAFYDLGYSLIDEIPYHFSDKRYLLAVGKTAVTLPDGLMKITCNGFRHANCGPITVGKTHIWNTVDKWRLAHIRGDVSSAWVDITMDTFHTSSISPFSTVRKRELALDNVTVAMGDVNIFSDNRNLTISDFRLPSKESVMEVLHLFDIRNINLSVRNIDTEITGHYSGSGHIALRDGVVAVNSEAGIKRLEADDIRVTFPDSPMRLEIDGVHTDHRTHNLIVGHALFMTDDHYEEGEQFHNVSIDSIVVENVMLPEIGVDRGVAASSLRIIHPKYTAYIDEHPTIDKKLISDDFDVTEDKIKVKLKEYQKVQQDRTLRFLKQWLDDASLDKICLERADVDIHSIRSGFSLRTCGFSLHTSGVGFSLENFMPMSFTDSVVNFDPIKSNFKLIGSSAVSYLALRDLHTTLPDSSMYLNVKRIDTDKDKRSLVISGVEFATDTVIPHNEMYHHATLDTLRFDGVILPDLADQKRASASALRIINGHYSGIISTAAKKDTVRAAKMVDESQAAKQERAIAIVQEWFDGASLDHIAIENVSADITDLSSDLKLKADGLALSLNDISYSLKNLTGLKFNDSEYSFGVDHVECLIPDSSFYIDAHNLRHANRGLLSLGRTTMYNTVDKWQIAHTHGDVPTTWFSMVLDTFRTSAIDPMRIVNSSYKLRLDSIVAVIDTMHMFRDMRYKPRKPYDMPQTPILSMPDDIVNRFSVNVADAAINTMEIEFSMTDSCVPSLQIDSIRGMVYGIDLHEGNNLRVKGDGIMGGGHAHVGATISLMPNCPWNIALQAQGIDLSCLDSLLFPIAGMTIKGNVTDLRAIYSGDSAVAEGYVLLAYNGLSATFHKGSPSPIKFIRNNPKFLTGVAKTFLPKANPKRPGRKPYAYKAKWKNDVWQPSATFLMGPMIKGVIETLLPGIYVHKRVSLDKLIIKHEVK